MQALLDVMDNDAADREDYSDDEDEDMLELSDEEESAVLVEEIRAANTNIRQNSLTQVCYSYLPPTSGKRVWMRSVLVAHKFSHGFACGCSWVTRTCVMA